MYKIKFIGIYQILTTIIFLIYLFIGNMSGFSFRAIPLYILVFLLMGFIFYAGYKLFDNPLKGIKLSIFAQLIQAIGFSIPGFVYLFSTSRFLSIIINDSFIGINFFKEIVAINIRFDKNIDSFGLQIFIIPVVFIVVLIIEGFKLEDKQKKDQIVSLD